MSILDDLKGRMSSLMGGADLRRAVEAEAGGNYLEAARGYAAAGERHKVAEMHLLASERAPTPDDKLECLVEAARWCDRDEDDEKKVRRRVAKAMLAWARARGLITENDRRVVEDAARMYLESGDAQGAASCHELLGASEAAAEAYQAAGEVDRLEQLLDGEAARRRRAVVVADAVEDHRLRLRAGDPGGALLALEAAVGAAEAKDRAGLTTLRDGIAQRRLAGGRLTLTRGAVRRVLALPPVTLGRAETCGLPLRDGGVSRLHAELRLHDGAWSVADRGSKNGTSLNGLLIADPLPLPPAGELGVGDRCAFAFTVEGRVLRMSIVRGLERELSLTAGDVPLTVRVGQAELAVRFKDGRPLLRSEGAALYLNGICENGEIEPLAGDTLELSGETLQVTA